MSISIRKPTYDDPDYDNCGSTRAAILTVDSISIPLCDECLKDLTDSVKEYQNTIFCRQCANRKMVEYSRYCYGFYCKKKVEDAGDDLKDQKAWNKYSVDDFDTCKFAKRKDRILGNVFSCLEKIIITYEAEKNIPDVPEVTNDNYYVKDHEIPFHDFAETYLLGDNPEPIFYRNKDGMVDETFGPNPRFYRDTTNSLYIVGHRLTNTRINFDGVRMYTVLAPNPEEACNIMKEAVRISKEDATRRHVLSSKWDVIDETPICFGRYYIEEYPS